MMAIDTIQPNSGIIRISCANSAYQQEHLCEVDVDEVKSLLDGLIEGWPMQNWEIEVKVEEIKVNAMDGEVQVWKVIYWRWSCSVLVFPLKECKQRKRYTK